MTKIELNPDAVVEARKAHDRATIFWQEHHDGYPLHLMPNVVEETIKAYLKKANKDEKS